MFLNPLFQRCPDLQTGVELAQKFGRLVRQRQGDALDAWMVRDHGTGVPRELRAFTDGLKADYQAVKAVLTLEWSTDKLRGRSTA